MVYLTLFLTDFLHLCYIFWSLHFPSFSFITSLHSEKNIQFKAWSRQVLVPWCWGRASSCEGWPVLWWRPRSHRGALSWLGCVWGQSNPHNLCPILMFVSQHSHLPTLLQHAPGLLFAQCLLLNHLFVVGLGVRFVLWHSGGRRFWGVGTCGWFVLEEFRSFSSSQCHQWCFGCSVQCSLKPFEPLNSGPVC